MEYSDDSGRQHRVKYFLAVPQEHKYITGITRQWQRCGLKRKEEKAVKLRGQIRAHLFKQNGTTSPGCCPNPFHYHFHRWTNRKCLKVPPSSSKPFPSKEKLTKKSISIWEIPAGILAESRGRLLS